MGSYRLVKLINPIAMTIAGTFTPKGAYNGATSYSIGDEVSYNGSSYILYAAAASGTLPTDTTKWGIIASKGDTGVTGSTGAAGPSDHTLLSNIGTNTHAQIDTALTRLANTSGTNTGDQDLTGKQNTLSLTTTGTSGAATLVGATLNVPQYTGGAGGATNLTTTAAPTTVTINSDTGTDAAIAAADVTNAGLLLPAEKTKLTGIATGATANSPDASLLARANHTGTQLAATVSDFSTAADARITAASGVSLATLSAGKIPSSQIPALGLVSVQTAASQVAQLALTTQEGDVVVRTDENKTYMRNAGVAGTMADFTLLNTPTDAVTSVNSQTGVVVLTKTDVGLANVDNTSDVNKPVSTAQAAANALKLSLTGGTMTDNLTINGTGATQLTVTSGSTVQTLLSANATGDAAEIGLGYGGGRYWHFGRQGDGSFAFVQSGVAVRMAIDTSGNFKFTGSNSPSVNATHNLGTSILYWLTLYATRHYFNATFDIDGATAGIGTVTGDLRVTTPGTNSASVATVGGLAAKITRVVATVTTTVTLGAAASTDYVTFIGASGVVTLPTAVSNTNCYTLKNITTSVVTISSTSAQTFDGLANIQLTQNQSIDLISDNSNWRLI